MFTISIINMSFKITNLTHWGRVTHTCVSKLTIIASDNGLSPGRHQAIFWTNAGILSIGPLETNFSEILIEIHIFSFKKISLETSSAKRWPFCFRLKVLRLGRISQKSLGLWNRQLLVHLPLDKMAAISQTMFSDAFSWMKSFVFWLQFHWSLFLMVQMTTTQRWLRSWLGTK